MGRVSDNCEHRLSPRRPWGDDARGRWQLSHVAVNIRNGLNRQDAHRQKSFNLFGVSAM
jgi:hypothetical protein